MIIILIIILIIIIVIIIIIIKIVLLINKVPRKAAEVPPSSLETNQVLKISS